MQNFIFLMFTLILSSCAGEKQSIRPDYKNFPSHSFEKSLAELQDSDKPIFVLFNAIGCLNCRRFEDLLTEEIGLEKIKKKYNFINLYLDDRNLAPESEWKEYRGKIRKTRGELNQIVQTVKLASGSQPYLAVFDKTGELIKMHYSEKSVPFINDFLVLKDR